MWRRIITDPCPVGQLFEPGNAVAIQTLGAGTGALILELAKTGTYTLLVTEHSNDQEESYRIALERLFPASSSALPLCFGCVATDTIDPEADRDFFFFEASQNDGITLTLTDLSGGCGGIWNDPCPVAYLYGPDRTLIDTLGAGTDSRTITLPQDGKYTIFLVENGEDQSESYNLALQCLFPADGKACGGEGVPEKCYGQNATIVGTNGDDTIYGTEGDDVIVGLKGNDVIYGLGGNDKICGGPGSDTIFGGLGDDRISGGDWSDALFGEEGNDVLSGGAGRDFLLGGLGNDKLFGDNGPDILFGGLGDDKLDGGEDSDVCDDSADTIDAVGCEITSAL